MDLRIAIYKYNDTIDDYKIHAYVSKRETPSFSDFVYTCEFTSVIPQLSFKINTEEHFLFGLFDEENPNFILGLELNKNGSWVEPNNCRFLVRNIIENEQERIACINAIGIETIFSSTPFSKSSITSTNTIIDGVININGNQNVMLKDVLTGGYVLPAYVSVEDNTSESNELTVEFNVSSNLSEAIQVIEQNKKISHHWDGLKIVLEDYSKNYSNSKRYFSSSPTSIGTYTTKNIIDTRYLGFSEASLVYSENERQDRTLNNEKYFYDSYKTIDATGDVVTPTDADAYLDTLNLSEAVRSPFLSVRTMDINYTLSNWVPLIDYKVGSFYKVEAKTDIKMEMLSKLFITESENGWIGEVVFGCEGESTTKALLGQINKLKGDSIL